MTPGRSGQIKQGTDDLAFVDGPSRRSEAVPAEMADGMGSGPRGLTSVMDHI